MTPEKMIIMTKDAIKRNIAGFLFAEMIRRDMTQAELAQSSGIPQGSLSRYINMQALMRPDVLVVLSRTLGVTCDDIVGRVS